MLSLSLKPVVNAYYNLGAISAPRMGFNLGAIIGSSPVIPTSTRGLVFESVDDMIAYGFSPDSEEVLAAQVYFAAESNPSSVYIARWAISATAATNSYNGPISNGNVVVIGDQTYRVGDGSGGSTTVAAIVEAATEAGATTANYTASSLNIVFTGSTTGASSVATSLEVSQDSGDAVGTVVSIAGENEETLLAAIQDARVKNNEWYAVAIAQEVDSATVLSIAAYIESTNNSAPSTYFAHSSDEDIVNAVEGNLFAQLSSLNYKRTIGTYSEQPYTHVGAMGYAMGQTRDTADSAYTLGLKTIPGSIPDDLTSVEVANVESYNANVYITRGAYYDIYEPGKVFSGAWFDEIIQLDKLCNNYQLDVMDLLYSNPRIAQTNAGMARILATLERRSQEAVKIGFVAPGQWNGANILNLASGDYLATGYLIQSESFESQSQADRDARKAPYIYVALKLAGAIQSVVIQVDVNR